MPDLSIQQIESRYKNLTGKSKKEIIKELGHEFNFYPNDRWVYIYKRKEWWKRKIKVQIYFDNEIAYLIQITKILW